jgi:hypothetical protein
MRFVLVPEAVRSRVEQDTHLFEHLREHSRMIASDPVVGAILELSADTGEVEIQTLGELISRLALRDRFTPILDWTSLELAGTLTGWTFFRPLEPDAGKLPYLDHTIGVVLVDDAGRMDEAERVAAEAAVLVATDETGGVIAAATRRIPSADSPEPSAELEESAVVVAERGGLPLPGCVEAAERLMAADPQVGGVAVKLFDAQGVLEAAGGAAFADGSVHGIASGAPVSAPWHEYVRPVPTAVGLVVLRPAAARECALGGDEEAPDLAGLSARLWSAGWELHYQPDAAAVRALEPASPGAAVWPQPSAGLPERPGELDHASWRGLLAREEVGAVR